jgi:hypothetical protein
VRDASLVVALLSSLLLVALAVALLMEPDRQVAPVKVGLNCPGLASKAVPLADELISVDENLHSFNDAEDLLCLDLPEPVLADGWRVTQVAVYGEARSFDELEESGLAYLLVGIELVNEGQDLALHVFEELGTQPFDVFEPVDTSRYAPGLDVRIDGEDGLLRFNDRGAFLVTWSKAGFQLYATGRREGLPKSLPVLESFE